MPIFNLFSKRLKRARGEMPDVFTYDHLPHALKVQIVHIVTDAFGVDAPYIGDDYVVKAYEYVNEALCREYGVFRLTDQADSKQEALFNFFLREESVERALDVVELCFKVVQNYIGQNPSYQHATRRKVEPEAAIIELNSRMKEHGVGYQFESGEIIRVDSAFVHAEIVKPVLDLLRDRIFAGANEEFLKAHENYRHSRYKECLVESLKAFESTMKTICTIRRWPTQPSDTAKSLIATCINNGLFPAHFDSQFSSLRSLLESGIPTMRNKHAGHGQGTAPVAVPEYLARYALNMTAATILFIVDAHRSLK